MSLRYFQRFSFIFLLLAIAVPAISLNWQGSGNLTQDNMTKIHNTIKAHPTTDATQADYQAYLISNHLNQIWDPAWNVVIANTLTGHDVILYGYAYRGHWMWINEYLINSDATSSQRLSYVIWKDYNCQNWWSLGDMEGASTFTSNQLNILNSYTSTGSASDPWANAHTLVEYVNTHNLFNTGAYSAVMCESKTCVLFAYICLVDRNFNIQNPFGGLNEGSAFLFQTRVIQH